MPHVYSLITLPAQSLRERSVEVESSKIGTPELQLFIDDLIFSMHQADGVGIAAPQVGKNLRIFIVNHTDSARAYINPEIIKTSESTMMNEEGCLSVPDVWGLVPRAKKISVKALDRHGRRLELSAKGYLAAVFQHETDHLNGILFIDRVKEFVKGKDSPLLKFAKPI